MRRLFYVLLAFIISALPLHGQEKGKVKFQVEVISTTLIAREDTPFVVGGIDYTITSKTITGIPILSWIPIIGYLFKREVTTTTDATLLAIVTPRILEFGELPEGK